MKVAELVADFIEALVECGMNLSDLSIVGHSLGAHVAGCAAKRLDSHRKIGSIIGLDPAAIGYDFDERENRLCDTDADYVQVIHTDIAKFGMAKPMGHGTYCNFSILTEINFLFLCLLADIYPNGGMVVQPGCKKRNLLTTWFGEFN